MLTTKDNGLYRYIDIMRNQATDIVTDVFSIDTDNFNSTFPAKSFNSLRHTTLRISGDYGSAKLYLDVQDANPDYYNNWIETGDWDATFSANSTQLVRFDYLNGIYRMRLVGCNSHTNVTVQLVYNR